jgi:molybdate/tungstate transport system substrate-binding protein
MHRKDTFHTLLIVAGLLVLALVAGCGPPQPTPSTTGLEGKLIVFHAGSLTVPMKALTEAFQAQHPGVTFETEASGSNAAARKISELDREADLMMSADYTVIDKLLIPDFADWNIQFARNTMLLVWQLAEKHYDVPGLNARLEEHCPLENVRPKSVELIALLESGDMDYAWEYRSVAVQHGLKFIELPDEINLSMVEHADFYSQATVEIAGKEPGTTMTMVGKPIVYGVTIPKNAPTPELAVEFVKFLLGPDGQAIMEQQGQPPIVPPVAGDVGAVPTELQEMVEAAPAAPAPTADVALSVTGAVGKELALSRADLEAMGAEELTVEHPKKGNQTYQGVRLSKILEAASPTGDTLTFTSDDGYSIDLALADAQACGDCLVAFDDDSLRLAMPGLPSNVWVKGVISIEVK